MNFELAARVSKMLTSSAKPAPLNGKPSAQKMSTYTDTPTNNLKKQGVGVTATYTKPNTVSNNKTGGALKKSYPVNVVHKALARLGGH